MKNIYCLLLKSVSSKRGLLLLFYFIYYNRDTYYRISLSVTLASSTLIFNPIHILRPSEVVQHHGDLKFRSFRPE